MLTILRLSRTLLTRPRPTNSTPTLAVGTDSQCHSCITQRQSARHFMTCTGCYQARYCNRYCQKAHWLFHKFNCKGYRLKNADLLVLDCWQDKFPEDSNVLEDFGFMNFFKAFDRQSLFLLYKDMVTLAGISAHSLDRWLCKACLREGIIQCYTNQKVTKLFKLQIEGSLKKEIITSYVSNGKAWDPQYGDCFMWFLKNHEIFSLETPSWTWDEKVDSWYATNRPLL